MKNITLILFFLIHSFGFSQIKIRLTTPSSDENRLNYDYQFLNKSDSIYIAVHHSEDMGHPYSRYYELKRDVPSGEYEIYINEVIDSKIVIDRVKKEMRKTRFNAKGLITAIQYFQNEEFIKLDVFDENGNIKKSDDRKY